MDDQARAVLEQAAAFEALLVALTSASNEERGGAESCFERCKASPEALVGALVRSLRTSGAQETRELAAVLLRKLLAKHESSLWPRLSAPTQVGVKAELLRCLQEEPTSRVTKKAGDAVCELAESTGSDGWPELLPFLFQAVQAAPDKLRESALLIFARLAGEVAPTLAAHLATLRTVLQHCLAPPSALPVRLAAMHAAVGLAAVLDTPVARRELQELVQPMLGVLGELLNAGDEESAQEALELFVELADNDARIMRRHFAEVAGAMIQIAEAKALEQGTRQLAVEFLLTLAEARDSAPGALRKLPALTARLFACALSFLYDIQEEALWDTAEEEGDMDAGQGEGFGVGMECLDRLAMALGAQAIVPLAAQQLPPLFASSDWRGRHAGLCGLSQVAEGCAKVLVKDPVAAVAPCLAALGDPHPRVRWAAINALGQLCTDLAPHVQAATHAQLLPGLIGKMAAHEHPRVQAHAAAAVINFAEECEAAVLADHMDSLVLHLLHLLQSPHRPTQEASLTSLASVADAAAAQFEKYYDTVVPYLFSILTHAVEQTHRLLRCKALECLTLVGLAVGHERFGPHAQGLIQLMHSLQGSAFEDDDPTPHYLLQAWTRLCKCLGTHFLPYLPAVMPPLLAMARLKPDVLVCDPDAAAEEEPDEDLQYIQAGDKVLSIRTSVLEDKATAVNMLCCYVEELKEGMLPYLEEIAAIGVPLLKFYFSEDVRTAAASLLPGLLAAGRAATQRGAKEGAWFQALLGALWAPLLAAAHSEPELQVTTALLLALSETVTACGASLGEAHIAALTAELRHQLQESARRRAECRAGDEGEEDGQEEDFENEDALEDELFDAVQECLSSLLKTFHGAYLPFLDTLMPDVLPMAAAPSPLLRRVAVCIFDDVMEFGSEQGSTGAYFDAFFGAVLAGCSDPDEDLRQACAYGVGVCAQHATVHFCPRAQEAAAVLCAVMAAPGARVPPQADAADNAASSLGKVLQFCREAVDASALFATWLSFLPLRADRAEARAAHAQLLALVQSGDAALLGAHNVRLARAADVFAEVLAAPPGELVTSETAQGMQALLPRMRGA